MSRSFTSLTALLLFSIGGASWAADSVSAKQQTVSPTLVAPLKRLFSHSEHEAPFLRMNVACTECHSFSVKTGPFDPLAPEVKKGFLMPDRKICHQCHLEKIQQPRRNQCTLCHQDTREIMPADHKNSWRIRHGQFAQADADSCKQCHSPRTCTECHTQRDLAKPAVHRPNFLMTHSIQARANPQSCVACHTSPSQCTDCHSRGKR